MRTRPISSSSPVPSSNEQARGRQGHRPVLLHEVSNMLDVQKDDTVVDATLGGAGHAEMLVKGLGGNGLFIGFDADSDALLRAKKRLTDTNAKAHLICGNFRGMEHDLKDLGVKSITKALFDLGWSSYQLDSGRGFSFKADEPLLMTYQKELRPDTITASTIVNTWGENSIADIIFGFGEERYARRIAKAIVEYRANRQIMSSQELADIIKASVPSHYRRGKLNPATRTFQALRIAVNDELGALSLGLEAAWKMLRVGGRIAVISFHSVEDRIVKRAFAEFVKKGEGRLLTKKPITPERDEIFENPRARSAKLRGIQKISHESKNPKDQQVRTLNFSGQA